MDAVVLPASVRVPPPGVVANQDRQALCGPDIAGRRPSAQAFVGDEEGKHVAGPQSPIGRGARRDFYFFGSVCARRKRHALIRRKGSDRILRGSRERRGKRGGIEFEQGAQTLIERLGRKRDGRSVQNREGGDESSS